MKTAHNGFSLIEMLVVVSIIGVMTVSAVASYNRLNDRLVVEETTKKIAAGLLSVKKDAVSGKGAENCASGDKFEGIQATWSGANKNFSLVVVCEGPTTVSIATKVPEKPVSGPVSVAVSGSIKFNSLSGSVSVQRTVTVTHTSDKFSKVITVNNGGGIVVGDTVEY